MTRLNSCSLLFVFALSKLATASPLMWSRQSIPSNVASGTITAGCTEFHTLASGETCLSIEEQFSISDALFHAMNPEINSGCTDLGAGEAYCVQTGNLTNIPNNVSPGTITSGCLRYVTVAVGEECPEIESQSGITNAFFHALNPQVNSACSDLIGGEAYCVSSVNPSVVIVPDNVADGTITNGCTEFHTVVSGDTCPSIETQFDISFAAFQTFNPEVDAACDNLLLGLAYCVQSSLPVSVPPPSNVASGTILTGCTDYFTIPSGQTCANIETTFGITLAFFLSLNTEVNASCTNLIANEAYCVSNS